MQNARAVGAIGAIGAIGPIGAIGAIGSVREITWDVRMITCPVSRATRVFFQRRVALFASVEDSSRLLGFEGHAEGMRARRAGRKRKGEGEGEGEQRRIIKEERKEEGAVDVDVDVDVDSFEAVAGCIDDETPSLIREADRHSFKIVGVTHFQTALRRAVAGGLSSVCTVIMEREPDNTYDKLAVAIKTLDGRQLGHIARQDNVGEGGKSVFWCPRLLGTANVESFVKNENDEQLKARLVHMKEQQDKTNKLKDIAMKGKSAQEQQEISNTTLLCSRQWMKATRILKRCVY